MEKKDNIKSLSFSESVDHMVDRAFAVLDMDPGVANAIKACDSIIQVNFSNSWRTPSHKLIFTSWYENHFFNRFLHFE